LLLLTIYIFLRFSKRPGSDYLDPANRFILDIPLSISSKNIYFNRIAEKK